MPDAAACADPVPACPPPGRPGALAPGAGLGDEELGAVAARIPALLTAIKAHGGPPPPELRPLIGSPGLGPRHFNALRHVIAGGRMSVSALGARLGVALPTASLMASELSRAGLLTRVEDDADRRRTMVEVAPERAAAIEAFLGRRLEPLRRALDRLSPLERAALVRGLDVLIEEFGAPGGPGPAGAEACPGRAGRIRRRGRPEGHGVAVPPGLPVHSDVRKSPGTR